MRATKHLICLASLFVLSGTLVLAAETFGNVEQVAGEAVTISVPADVRVASGDRFEIVVEVPKVGTAQVASGEVAAVVGKLVMGKIVSATGKVAVGQKVRFLTTEVATPPPPPDAVSAGKPLPIVIAGYVTAQAATTAKLDGRQGALIEALLPAGAADTLLPGDVVLAIDGRVVGRPATLYDRLARHVRETVVLDIARKGVRLQRSVTLSPNTEAVQDLEKRAEEGDIPAQRTLAYHKLYAIGVESSKADSATWFRKAADAGDELAQLELSKAYLEGRGVEKSDEEAYKWCQAATKKDLPEARSQLGWLTFYGRGEAANRSEARKWFLKAANQGDARALLAIGNYHYFGWDNVPKDRAAAAKWYRKSAEAGHPQAMSNLGYSAVMAKDYAEAARWYRKAADYNDVRGIHGLAELYAAGKGVNQNDVEAAKWFRLAADLGNKFSQFSLGRLYEKGQGVPKDREQAIAWYRKAAAQRHEPARQALTNLGSTAPVFGPKGGGFTEVHALRGHKGAVFMVAVTPDGRRALTTGIDGTLRTWNLASGAEVSRIQAHEDWAVGLVLSPDGKQAVTSGNDATIRLWDLETDEEVRRFEGHTDAVWSVTYSSDGKRLLTGSHDKTMRLWNVRSGEEVRQFEGNGSVWAACLSPDGTQVLSAERTGLAAIVWDAATGEKLRTLEGPAVTVAFSSDGTRALTGGWRGMLSLWDAKTGKELRKFEGHKNCTRMVAFAPDGKRAATTGYDSTVRLWDLETGIQLAQFNWRPEKVPKQGGVEDYMLFGVAYTPDGKRVVAAGADGVVRVLAIDLQAAGAAGQPGSR